MYIYISNEGSKAQEIYFDDFTILHKKSPVIQTDDYYPFGLTFNSHRRENSSLNKYQYNGKELQNALDLNWLDYGARMYLPDLGRWKTIDPLAAIFNSNSPYNYANNNPIRFIDLHGMSSFDQVHDFDPTSKRGEPSDYEEYKKYLNNTGSHVIGTCPSCPNGKEYDQYRKSEYAYAYREDVGVYNDIDVTVSATRGLPGVDEIEGVNKINDWASAYTDMPGLALAITSKELYKNSNLAYNAAYSGAYNGLIKVNSGFKVAGTATGVASLALAGYLAADKYDKGQFNTSTVVDLTVSGVFVIGGFIAGTTAAPVVIAGGLVYGVARIAAGDEIDAWIDKNFDSKSFWYKK
jgi:RHS repeat-associated protein